MITSWQAKTALDELLTECYNCVLGDSSRTSRGLPARTLQVCDRTAQSKTARPSLPTKTGSPCFRQDERYIGHLAKESKSEDVHRFRTNSRRVEALLTELARRTATRRNCSSCFQTAQACRTCARSRRPTRLRRTCVCPIARTTARSFWNCWPKNTDADRKSWRRASMPIRFGS